MHSYFHDQLPANTGKEFFVSAFLDASVCCGQTVDSSHTLELQFNDASSLISRAVPNIVTAAPEPSMIALMAIGVMLLAFSWQRSRRPSV